MSMETVEFTVKCRMRKRWMPYFVSMLKKMEELGEEGSSKFVTIYSDGDGDFRPEFHFSQLCDSVEPTFSKDNNHVYDAG